MEKSFLVAQTGQPRTNSFRAFFVPFPRAGSLSLLRELMYNELTNVTLGLPSTAALTGNQLRQVFNYLPMLPGGAAVMPFPVLTNLRRVLTQALADQQVSPTGLLPGRDKASMLDQLSDLVTIVCGELKTCV